MTVNKEQDVYWKEKKSQHQREIRFMAEAKAGKTYRIERYAIPQTGIPHTLSNYANIHKKQTVTIYTVHNEPYRNSFWFTTTTGEAIEADTLIKWEQLPVQKNLFD